MNWKKKKKKKKGAYKGNRNRVIGKFWYMEFLGFLLGFWYALHLVFYVLCFFYSSSYASYKA